MTDDAYEVTLSGSTVGIATWFIMIIITRVRMLMTLKKYTKISEKT